MRVNEVIITRIDGASDSTVNNAISWMMRSFSPLRAGACPPLLACVMRLRDAAPFPRGFDRLRLAPQPIAAPACAAPDDARYELRPAPRIAAVPAGGCAAEAA